MNRKFTCIVCPNGCEIEVDYEGKDKGVLIPRSVYQDIIDLYLDEDEAGDMTDPRTGYDIKIIRSGSGKNDTTYSARASKPTKLDKKYSGNVDLESIVRSQIKDYDELIIELEKFLQYIDNWATCDLLSLRIVKKNLEDFLEKINKYIKSDQPYTIRFGISMLMKHYLDDNFKIEYANKVTAVQSEEYYVNMMRAWYFATALAKQYDSIIPFIKEKRLDVWTHNKAIQKSIESYRITPEQKGYLRTLKIK